MDKKLCFNPKERKKYEGPPNPNLSLEIFDTLRGDIEDAQFSTQTLPIIV